MNKKFEVTIDGINEETHQRKVLTDTLDVSMGEYQSAFIPFFEGRTDVEIIDLLESGKSLKLFPWVDEYDWDWIVKEVKEVA